MFLLLATLAVAAPTAAQVQVVERDRVIEPLVDRSADGKSYVELAPDVETRGVTCTPAEQDIFECAYEARVRPAFEQNFGPWEQRHERLAWRRDCWIRLDGSH